MMPTIPNAKPTPPYFTKVDSALQTLPSSQSSAEPLSDYSQPRIHLVHRSARPSIAAIAAIGPTGTMVAVASLLDIVLLAVIRPFSANDHATFPATTI